MPIAWEALEDAFENNAPNVRSYLHLETGEVLRAVDGLADPAMLAKVVSDPLYLHVEPVSSRQQYRWMESFIETVEDPALRRKLYACIDGKGAFRRFKDALMQASLERERWFTYRSDRIQTCIRAWLKAHEVETVGRSSSPARWSAANANTGDETASAAPPGPTEDSVRRRLHALVDMLQSGQLSVAQTYLEFLCVRGGGDGGTEPEAATPSTPTPTEMRIISGNKDD